MLALCHTSALNEVTPLHLAQSWGVMGDWWSSVLSRLFHPRESPTLRSPDKCCWSFSFLLPSWRWLGDSHATTQCLNKRVCLIQLSPQGCAKWALGRFDRDNEQGEWRRRGCGAEDGVLGSFRCSHRIPFIFYSVL